jgi:hypothetical protein
MSAQDGAATGMAPRIDPESAAPKMHRSRAGSIQPPLRVTEARPKREPVPTFLFFPAGADGRIPGL